MLFSNIAEDEAMTTVLKLTRGEKSILVTEVPCRLCGAKVGEACSIQIAAASASAHAGRIGDAYAKMVDAEE